MAQGNEIFFLISTSWAQILAIALLYANVSRSSFRKDNLKRHVPIDVVKSVPSLRRRRSVIGSQTNKRSRSTHAIFAFQAANGRFKPIESINLARSLKGCHLPCAYSWLTPTVTKMSWRDDSSWPMRGIVDTGAVYMYTTKHEFVIRESTAKLSTDQVRALVQPMAGIGDRSCRSIPLSMELRLSAVRNRECDLLSLGFLWAALARAARHDNEPESWPVPRAREASTDTTSSRWEF